MNPINSPQPWLLHLSPIVRTLLEVPMNMTAGTTETYNPGDPYASKRVVKGGASFDGTFVILGQNILDTSDLGILVQETNPHFRDLSKSDGKDFSCNSDGSVSRRMQQISK
jgi:hypothetical protein